VRGQVSFEAMISVGMLMFLMAAIVFGINSNIDSFYSRMDKDLLEDSCAKINNGVLTALDAPNTSVVVDFSDNFNLSFEGGNGLTLSRNGFEYLCLVFTDSFVNSSINYPFNFLVESNVTFLSGNGRIVVS